MLPRAAGRRKYLKAYLADRDLEIVHTHNLFKLVSACAESDPVFNQLIDVAELLTPFAVEARYDAEFWPAPEVMEQAESAAGRVAKLVCLLVQSVKVLSPVFAQAWKKAREAFSWRVDLSNFNDARKYPGFFNRIILPDGIEQFEADFRAEMEFCRRQAAALSWRARDVEMAVWTDTDAQLPLNE